MEIPMPTPNRPSECLYRILDVEPKNGKPPFRIANFVTPDCEGHDFLEKNGVIVSDPWKPMDWRDAVTCTSNVNALEDWEKNYEKLSPIMTEPCDLVDTTDIVYLVAPGPSLVKNMFYLRNIKYGKVIGMNIIPKLGIECDYYGSMDYSVRPENCFNGDERLIGIFTPQVNWRLPISPVFTRRLWGIPEYDLPVYVKARSEHPKLPGVTTTPNTSMFLLEWAALYLKPKIIVLVGMDFCGHFIDQHTIRQHVDGHDDITTEQLEQLCIEEKQDKNKWKEAIMPDILGNKVIDIKVYNRILKYHIPFFWFCIDHGIRIVNATEGGLLFESCTCMRLENAINMCNIYGETKDEKYLFTQGTTQSEPIEDLDKDEFFRPLREKQRSGKNYDKADGSVEGKAFNYEENENGSNEKGVAEAIRTQGEVVPCGACSGDRAE